MGFYLPIYHSGTGISGGRNLVHITLISTEFISTLFKFLLKTRVAKESHLKRKKMFIFNFIYSTRSLKLCVVIWNVILSYLVLIFLGLLQPQFDPMETRQRSRALMSARIFDSWLVLGGIECAPSCAQFHTLKKLAPIATDEKSDKKLKRIKNVP